MSDIRVVDKIVWVKLSDIKPYWRNPRNNDETVDALVKAIKLVGFNVPIVLDKDNVIVKGHARYRAALALGMSIVPCIISLNTDRKNKADRIADNKIQELSYYLNDVLDNHIGSMGEQFQAEYDRVLSGGYDEAFDEFVLPVDDFGVVESNEVGDDKLNDDESERFVMYVTFTCPYCGHINKVRKE